MSSLKDQAMHRISKLADIAIKNDPFGNDVDKADVIAPFPEMMENGIMTAEEILSMPDAEFLRRLARIVAAEALAYSGSLLTPEQLDTLEEVALGKKLRRAG
jgi:hypothetical protein